MLIIVIIVKLLKDAILKNARFFVKFEYRPVESSYQNDLSSIWPVMIYLVKDTRVNFPQTIAYLKLLMQNGDRQKGYMTVYVSIMELQNSLARRIKFIYLNIYEMFIPAFFYCFLMIECSKRSKRVSE